MSKETSLIEAILRYLRLRGCFVWRNNTGVTVYGRPGERRRFVRYGLPGSADILGCAPDGRFLAVEAKRGRTATTERQTQFLEEVRRRGGVALRGAGAIAVAARAVHP